MGSRATLSRFLRDFTPVSEWPRTGRGGLTPLFQAFFACGVRLGAKPARAFGRGLAWVYETLSKTLNFKRQLPTSAPLASEAGGPAMGVARLRSGGFTRETGRCAASEARHRASR